MFISRLPRGSECRHQFKIHVRLAEWLPLNVQRSGHIYFRGIASS
jgi:hypothetical protein